MTNEETIKSLKRLKNLHNGNYGTVLDTAIKAIEKVETYEKMMDELLQPIYGGYEQHKFTHEYGDVVTVEDLRYTFEEARRADE